MRLPVFYGWVVVAVAFITIAIGVNARTAFSLLYPPILEEFGWSRGVTAATFSVGFLASAILSPFIGMAMDRFGPRLVFPFGGVVVAVGFMAATLTTQPWHLFATLGLMVVGGSVLFSYVGHSAFLPNWFVRRRGLAIGIAFSGVGVLSLGALPWVQIIIDDTGWRTACWMLAMVVLVVVLPLNLLFQRRRPEDLGGRADGDADVPKGTPVMTADNVVDPAWVAVDWTLGRALKTTRFWWLGLGFFASFTAYYTILVHQTRFLIDIGFSGDTAAFALGLVSTFGVVSLIATGALSDRWGREIAWTLTMLGYVACYSVSLLLVSQPSWVLVAAMVITQGLLGQGMATCFAAMPAELFQGRYYGKIFGALSLFGMSGGAVGPWLAGVLYDHYGSYEIAFIGCIVAALIGILGAWMAAPRKVRKVAGQINRSVMARQ
jgi:MFS family permease